MRIEPLRVSQPGEVRRVDERQPAASRVSVNSTLEDTTDLLAISSSVRVARQRDILIDGLREAYRSGALRPDSERIAERLIDWGFHPREGERP